MNIVLVFVPCSLYNDSAGFLRGEVEVSSDKKLKTFYILGKYSALNVKSSKDINIIGYYHRNRAGDLTSDTRQNDWIELSRRCGEFRFSLLISGGNAHAGTELLQTICIIYDRRTFLKSELLVGPGLDVVPHKNNFKTLTHYVKTETIHKIHTKSSVMHYTVQTFLQAMLFMVNFLLRGSAYLQPVLKYSSLGLQVHVFLQSLTWALKTTIESGRPTLKVGNYVVATIVDISSGVLFLYWIMSLVNATSSASLHQLLMDAAAVVVSTLKDLLKWLMGNPAGLKLNFALSNMLGQFFLYHINLWWTFLVVTKPLLLLAFNIFLCFGQLGLTFQASILADLLALVSFHIYCIYVYAARLFNLQVFGLIALWRLFLGKKKNPLRNRVDSCHYSPDQLFIGTLAFTILLFLLPTVLLYYIVFTTLRLLMVGLGGLLTRVRFLLQALPLYATFLWLAGSSTITSSIHLTVCPHPDALLLSVTPITESWWKTVLRCIPDPIHWPPTVEWGKLLTNLATGQLIYPV